MRVKGILYRALIVVIAVMTVVVATADVSYAGQITSRSLTLMANGATGGSAPGGTVHHKYTFTIPTTGTALGSIKFEYCTVASVVACTVPTGMDASTATFGSETGSGATGFSMGTGGQAPTANVVIIARASASNPSNGNLTYTINTVKNPTTTNYTFFVRISTYTSLDATGSAIDTGTVAASTATPIQLTGVMPESLIFCTGATITVNSGVPDCSSATAGVISFNQLFSPSDTATAVSQMAASTNAYYGYAITVNGPTLTSGSATIPAMGTAGAGLQGTSQFGMNVVANTTTTSTPAVGSAIDPTSDGTDLRGQALVGYNTPDTFKFASGDTVADSGYNTGIPGPTNGQRYTASYIANVAGNQLAGTYTTTLTYICTPTF